MLEIDSVWSFSFPAWRLLKDHKVFPPVLLMSVQGELLERPRLNKGMLENLQRCYAILLNGFVLYTCFCLSSLFSCVQYSWIIFWYELLRHLRDHPTTMPSLCIVVEHSLSINALNLFSWVLPKVVFKLEPSIICYYWIKYLKVALTNKFYILAKWELFFLTTKCHQIM